MLLLGRPACLCISVHRVVSEERLLRVVHREGNLNVPLRRIGLC